MFWTEDANRNCIWVRIELSVPYKCSPCFPCRLPGWCQITCALDRHIVTVVGDNRAESEGSAPIQLLVILLAQPTGWTYLDSSNLGGIKLGA